jgi:hypothetical protein
VENHREDKVRTLISALLLFGLAACASTPSGASSESQLESAMNAYFAALDSHDVSAVPVSANARITYNGESAKLADGLPTKLRKLTYRRFFSEAAAGQIGAYGAAEEMDGAPVVFYVRMKVGVSGKADEVEIVDAHKGEASVFEPESLVAIDAPILPPEQRTPRAQMIAAANAYFDGIERADGSNIPTELECLRIENGRRTTPPLKPGATESTVRSSMHNFTYITKVRDRRHLLIDEERGLIWTLGIFDIPGGNYQYTLPDGTVAPRVQKPRSIYIAELFTIHAGKISRIDVTMRNAEFGKASAW